MLQKIIKLSSPPVFYSFASRLIYFIAGLGFLCLSFGIVTIKFEVFLNILFLSFKINQPQQEIEENHRKRKSKTNPNNGFMTHLISTRQSF